LDIAHALSLQCRYAGHCGVFYSVAQHSTLVSHYVPPRFALQGLLHDAMEAYLTDIPRGLKALPELAGYRKLERQLWKIIATAFKLPRKLHPSVLKIDDQIVENEKLVLFDHGDQRFINSESLLPFRLEPLDAIDAEKDWLERFYFLRSDWRRKGQD